MERFNIELKKRDCSGIYAVTQRLMTYNSNKIAGSTLTEERIAFLFDTGSLPPSDHDYRAKDIAPYLVLQTLTDRSVSSSFCLPPDTGRVVLLCHLMPLIFLRDSL